jgi:two-component system, cell cycle response regulator CtrA
MRLLLIEDDPSVAGSIELMLKSENFQVETTHLGEHGVSLGRVNEYELIVLDLNLPDISGYEVLRSLRVNRIRTPVLILSGLADIQDKVKGFGFGADDYLTKPFHKDELLARIRAVVRRAGHPSEAVIRCGDLAVKLDHKRVEIAGRNLDLTRREYEIIELLASRQGWRKRLHRDRPGTGLHAPAAEGDESRELNDRLGHPSNHARAALQRSTQGPHAQLSRPWKAIARRQSLLGVTRCQRPLATADPEDEPE